VNLSDSEYQIQKKKRSECSKDAGEYARLLIKGGAALWFEVYGWTGPTG